MSKWRRSEINRKRRACLCSCLLCTSYYYVIRGLEKHITRRSYPFIDYCLEQYRMTLWIELSRFCLCGAIRKTCIKWKGWNTHRRGKQGQTHRVFLCRSTKWTRVSSVRVRTFHPRKLLSGCDVEGRGRSANLLFGSYRLGIALALHKDRTELHKLSQTESIAPTVGTT
jgi:hypothetical protein